MRKTGLVWDKLFMKHLEGVSTHPEKADRLRFAYKTIKDEGLDKSCITVPLKFACLNDISLIHDEDYFNFVQDVEVKEGYQVAIDAGDTVMTAKSLKAALAAAGSGIELVNQIWDGKLDNGYSIVRPPGHHAIAHRAMGFCIFNNIAIAAEHLIKNRGLKKVAIVDFDIHHGNGTNDSFYDRSDLLYISTHQSPFFPGTGDLDEAGEDAGLGYSLNIPMQYGMSDTEFVAVYQSVIVPVLEEFEPEMILVSTGYDLHESDPIGGCMVSDYGVTKIASLLIDAASKVCDGRVAFFLEGGYNLETGARLLSENIKLLLGQIEMNAAKDVGKLSADAALLLNRIKQEHARYWKCIENLEVS